MIILKPDQLFDRGWVYLHDLYLPNHGKFKINGKEVLSFRSHWQSVVGRCNDFEMEITYLNENGLELPQKYRYRNSNHYFFGPQILEGIALGMLQILRGVDPLFRDQILNPADFKELKSLISKVYHP